MICNAQVDEHAHAVTELGTRVLIEFVPGVQELLDVLDPRRDVLEAVDPLCKGGLVESGGDFIDEVQCELRGKRGQLIAQLGHKLRRVSWDEHRCVDWLVTYATHTFGVTHHARVPRVVRQSPGMCTLPQEVHNLLF